MKMLDEEGRIVYSTCSMNPVENEAVVAAALKSDPGKQYPGVHSRMTRLHAYKSPIEYELIDVSSRLPALVRRPGLHTWKPTVDKFIDTSFATYEAFIGSLSEERKAETKMLENHWPPTKEEAESLRLERW
jgi:multisite-specific tRNA:(cytosine-C5)-methyltransferase